MPDEDDSLTGDEAILREMRDRYTYATHVWQESREQRAIDLRYLNGDPWDENDRKDRDDDGRPCISHDEITQYVNQAVNNIRQNKRSIRVSPEGGGADEETADFQENLVRTIQKNSKADQVFCQTYQNMVEGSYATMRVGRKYIKGSFDQEITIKGIPNPDSVLHDPDCKEPDWSDQKYCFVLEPIPRKEFKKRWPKAKQHDFTLDDMRIAPEWIQDDKIVVAEYWRLNSSERELVELASGKAVPKDEVPAKAKLTGRTRTEEVLTLQQLFTNGIEILEKTDQPGELIPLIPMMGLERWVDDGGGAKRKLSSLFRLARDPQMSLAYLCSQQMEEAGLTPKTPFTGYVGQFETDAEAWKTVTKKPHAFLQVDVIIDAATGAPLPLPRREPFTPNFQAYEVAKDSCRRAIQAAMGISPLPTAAQRNNEKSGVALEKITEAQGVGTYHFVDSYERALDYAGRVILAWIPVTYDTEREMALRKPDDSHQIVRLNTEEPYFDQASQKMKHFRTDEGDHTPDISASPSYQSQQEEAADFLDTLIKNLKDLPIAPPQAAKLLSLAIQMRHLGPKGDEMAEIISPKDQGQGQQQQQQLAAQHQQMQMMAEQFQKMQAALQKLQLERAGKVIDNQAKMQLEQMRLENALAIAEIETKAQDARQRQQTYDDMLAQFHEQAHDHAMQADAQGADAAAQASDQANAQASQASDQAHQQGMATQAQDAAAAQPEAEPQP